MNSQLQTKLKDLAQKFVLSYSKIGKSNHYIVLLGIFLLFNFIIIRTGISISLYIIPIVLGFFLNMIFSTNETYIIEVNNNGVIESYTDVKYKLIVKKNQLIIYERNGNKTTISQGNYTIRRFENGIEREKVD